MNPSAYFLTIMPIFYSRDFMNHWRVCAQLGTKMGPTLWGLGAMAIVGLGLFMLGYAYWVWYKKNVFSQTTQKVSKRKPTLFDVRDLLNRKERQRATKVYRQIFQVSQKEAQQAVDALEKSMHQQG